MTRQTSKTLRVCALSQVGSLGAEPRHIQVVQNSVMPLKPRMFCFVSQCTVHKQISSDIQSCSQRLPAVYDTRELTQEPRRSSVHVQHGDNLVGEACRHMLPISRPAHLRQLTCFAPESPRASPRLSGVAGSSSTNQHTHTHSCMLRKLLTDQPTCMGLGFALNAETRPQEPVPP